MSDIFISYARPTAAEAQRIAQALRALGYGVWYDEDLPAHRAFADVIEERLNAARAVVVVWSAAAARSEWVRSEAESARANRKLVQLTIDGARLPMPFDQIECANLVGWTGDPQALGWRKVVASVADLTASGVDLARVPDFQLGDVLFSPSTLRMQSPGAERKVEPKVMEVLVALVRNAGRTVTRDQLIESCWGGATVSGATVNKAIAQLRALSRSVDPPPFELETVPKVGFRLVLAEAPTTHAPDPPTVPLAARAGRLAIDRRTLISAAMALAAVVVAAGLAWRFLPHGGRPDQNGRVAVTAFAAQGPGPALQKAATDVSGTIVRVLAGGGVSVAPAAAHAAGSDAEIRIGGRVGFEGSDYAVEAQIVDSKSERVLWTSRFVRTAPQIQATPGGVGFNVAAVLHCALEDRKRSHSRVSTEAFGLYLNACAAVFGDHESAGRMLAVTRQLVKVAPKFAGAHAMHSIAAANEAGEMTHSAAEAAALHAESKAAAERALQLDPDTPKAYSGLALNEGALTNRPNQNRILEEDYIRKALKLDPDLPPARNEYASLLRSVGRIQEAIEFMRATDPLDPRNFGDTRVAMLLASTGDLEGAEAMLKQLEGDRDAEDQMRWTIAFWWTPPKSALPKIRALAPADTPRDQVECMIRYLTELDARKASRAHGLPAICATMDENWRVRMLAREGDLDGAFAALNGQGSGSSVILYYPEMKALRRDPRFWPLAARFGLSDYWIKSGRWPDFCMEPDLPFDCRKAAMASKPNIGLS